VVAGRDEEVIRKFDIWREGLEEKRLRVNLSKNRLTVGWERHNTKKTLGNGRVPLVIKVCGLTLKTVH